MRQKQLVPPEQILLDRATYRFKASFLRIFSSFAIVGALPLFVVRVLLLILSTSTDKNIQTLDIAILFMFVFIFLYAYCVKKVIDIVVSPVQFSGHDMWGRRVQIDWGNIILIKSYSFGTRSISIRSTTDRRKNIQIGLWLYDLPKILDRVREYAGEDHPLTIALEKEVSLPRQKPIRVLWRSIIGIAFILSIWLIGGNLYADYKERPLNQAIANYVRQHPKTPPNQTAIDLQASIAKLGISIEKFGDGSKVKVNPEKAVIVEWNAIEPTLDRYLLLDSEVAKSEDSFQPLPTKLRKYLKTHQTEIDAVRDRLINHSLPDWGSDSRWVEHTDPNAGDSWTASNMNYWNLTDVRRLFLARILDRQQSPNPDNKKDLEAIGNLNRSLQNQTLLSAQLASQVTEEKINRLIRRLDIIPDRWEQILINPER